VDYKPGEIVPHLKGRDPCRADPNRQLPAVTLSLVQLQEQGGPIIEAWNLGKAA
jgi:hypothetical protein